MRKTIVMLLWICFVPITIIGQNSIRLNISDNILQMTPLADNAIRIRVNQSGEWTMPELVYTEGLSNVTYKVTDSQNTLSIKMGKMSVYVDKQSGLITYYNTEGKEIVREKERALLSSEIQGEKTLIATQRFYSPKDEYLFGLGQFQDGYLNVRGLTRRLTQVNTQISIPFVLSNKGYGILWNNYGLTEFNPSESSIKLIKQSEEGETTTVNVTSTEGNKKEVRQNNAFTNTINIKESGDYALLLDVGRNMARAHHLQIDGETIIDMKNIWLPPTTSAIVHLSKGHHIFSANLENGDQPTLYYKKVTDETTFSSPVSQGIDYTVFIGSSEEVMSAYNEACGKSPMIPLWALGYIHCRERFHSSEEILSTVNRFRKEGLPLDMIVQDWQYWGKYGWNAMKFDENNYPDPKLLTDSLHKMNTRFMLSVWSKIDKNSTVGKEMAAANYYIPGTDWIDFFCPEAAACYWKNFSEGLLKPYGIDAWWQDATEPENDDLRGRKINNATTPGEFYRNVYPLFVNKTVYEGCRKDQPSQRSMILTRCGFSGIQKYGTVVWSGDVGYNYETLQRQITAGLGLVSSGLPWWTFDAGGFFRPGYGQYQDKNYHQLFARWLEFATFAPMMRVHGYQTDTEFWRYGEEVMLLARKYLKVRYSLMPYIYSEAAKVSHDGSSIMRPLIMDYANDTAALNQSYEYLFGQSLLVAPVFQADVKTWQVYLPDNLGGWYDFWDNTRYESNAHINVPVSIEKIPVFVKAGSILPMIDDDIQSSADITDKPIRIKLFPGADGEYELYQDDGISHDYENGIHSTIRLSWNDHKKELTIHKREGLYHHDKTIVFLLDCERIVYKGKTLRYRFP